MTNASRCILVMGVSGSGKSRIGRDLAAALNVDFIDGDDHHPPANIAKMARGEPLDDRDRQGWLELLADLFRHYRLQRKSVVIACSALKTHYRDLLRQGAPNLEILYLHGTRALLLERLATRKGHFFGGEHMLDSQLHDLEPPTTAEAVHADIQLTPPEIVEKFLTQAKC